MKKLELKSGFVNLVGIPNSGKSTLINLIMGLLKPSKGSVVINGININDNSIVGAGSTLTKDVEKNLIAVERSKQKQFKRRKKT